MPDVYWKTAEICPVDSIPYEFGPMVQSSFLHSGTYLERTELVRDILYRMTVFPVLGSARNARFIPGCFLNGKAGPAPADVMIVGRAAMPPKTTHTGSVELDNLMGDALQVLLAAFTDAGYEQKFGKLALYKFYLTNMVRFARPDFGKGALRAAWIREGLHFLCQELNLVKPKYILCFGTEASKFFTGYSITKAQSQVFDYKRPDGGTAKVICTVDPCSVLKNFELRPQLLAGLRLFAKVVAGEHQPSVRDRDYFYVDDAKTLKSIIDSVIEAGHTTFAVDCEWGGGQHFLDRGAALRTVQIAWSGSECVVVILRRQHMKEAFSPYVETAFSHIRRLLCRPGVKVVGHNIMADYPWLHDQGVDISSQLYFDTMLASHLFEPTASHRLEDVAVRCLGDWERHDMALTEWKQNNDFAGDLGYAQIPDDILHLYSAGDVCSTYQLFEYYKQKFEQPEHEGLRKLFAELVMPALPAFIEIEMIGVWMDQDRLRFMEEAYRDKHQKLLGQFRAAIGNPGFNPNSSQQKTALLFDTLKLVPVKETGKYPKMWDRIQRDGQENERDPSTDGETLDILSHRSPVAKQLRNITLLSTMMQNFLPAKELNARTGELEYRGGLMGGVKLDGRLHTSIGQMLKTGRLASSDPNLMNMPNKQEDLLEPIFGIDTLRIRTAFTAPLGCVLVLADYVQAEVATLAYLSGDPTLIAAIVAGEDVHSIVGIKMFKMGSMSPAEFREKHNNLRISAKTVVFGIFYGRGAVAIAREIEKAGVSCTVDDAKAFIDAFMEQFPLVRQFIDDTHRQVTQQGYVETLWGRREYFPFIEADDGSIESRQKRQAVNFLIQSYVAELLRKALINLQAYRRENPLVRYKLILTVHDSIMLEVPVECAEHVADFVIPECMTRRAPAPRLGFTIKADVEVVRRWDEELYYDELVEMGLSEPFCLKYCKKNKETKEPLKRLS